MTYIVTIPSDEGKMLDYSILIGTLMVTFAGLFGIVLTKIKTTNKSKSEEKHE